MIRVDIDAVTQIIREVAAERILPRFRNLKDGDISFKIGDDPVTIADKEAEIDLSNRFLDLLPGSKVVGEEAFALNSGLLTHFSGESPVWIIDPVDGTRNFTAGSSDFGTIVALSERNQVVAGWIYDPTSNEVITVEKGSGAWFKGERLKTLPPTDLLKSRGYLGERIIRANQKAGISAETSPDFSVNNAGSHSYPTLVIGKPHFNKDVPQVHFFASHSYTTPWDDGAAILIHEEAGGYCAMWNGEKYRPDMMHRGQALAPSKESWNELKNWCQSFCELPAD